MERWRMTRSSFRSVGAGVECGPGGRQRLKNLGIVKKKSKRTLDAGCHVVQNPSLVLTWI